MATGWPELQVLKIALDPPDVKKRADIGSHCAATRFV